MINEAGNLASLVLCNGRWIETHNTVNIRSVHAKGIQKYVSGQQWTLRLQFEFCAPQGFVVPLLTPAIYGFGERYLYFNAELVNCLFLPTDSPPTRMTQASSVFFGSQDLGRDCSFLKPQASTPGNKTLPIGEALFLSTPVIFLLFYQLFNL